MRIPPIDWTNDMLEILVNNSYSCQEVAKLLNLRVGTVRNKRKSLGIKNDRSKVMSKPRPYRVKKETRICAADNCVNTFIVVPSRTKKYCSHSCDVRTNHRAPKGIGSRSIRNPHIDEYKRYAREVHRLSNQVYHQHKEQINPDNHPRTVCGVEGGWQLDHIIPVKQCFETGMTVTEAARIDNLRMLPWKQNLMRQYLEH